ncbi:tRNA (adenosine(37)-N6)-threonylcarbamoyltransferase complex dimerization subunit type 1 TsaB [Arthrobacter sp. JZ12]|uniref:tRNA (adenosine(37)-N6)-threonylcarbamoyltransferase complex dimerization subunit type 1 TsaB n=1 Tax=Arthrobacter sp. JZ12 TaxID=2654190 RepID=UPI002B486B65|nr:tRNA (adenosine(37)-N6)-threonylcarbamoyltransferase complex dimerization subunit type 1 TsaB [Arthrobacter sp. JZ12]WRH25545.1 tRNA (adenosine(37)-N6)-threonylcarbamoyltransferase complex dimerization subunit type 1 TsaB [Arthrobacter sp. JZ12]
MLILSLDTSAAASAAVIRDGEVLQRFSSTDTRSHAEVLAPAIQQLLADADVAGTALDAIVVGVGPGPFTGLRAGIATARMLAFVWGVPLHGVMSLDAVALDAGHPDGEFAVATDARRKEVYWARYRAASGLPELVDGPHVGPAETVPELPVYGHGAGLYAERLAGTPHATDLWPDAAALAVIAERTFAAGGTLRPTTPLYLRESDAKVPGPRKKALL